MSLVTLEETVKNQFSQIIRDNDRWLLRNQKVIEAWIEKNNAASAVVSSMLLLVFVTIVQLVFG